jgi:hypothetical protein
MPAADPLTADPFDVAILVWAAVLLAAIGAHWCWCRYRIASEKHEWPSERGL